MKKNGTNEFEFDSSDKNTFWMKLFTKDKDGNIDCNGQVRMRIDVFPKEKAEKNPVGKARDEPNHSPYLKPPEGRIEFSMNPLKMLKQLVGPEFLMKV